MSSTPLKALVKSMRHEADNIVSIELLPKSGVVFPRFEAGAHIDVHLPNGLIRSYSLCNDPNEVGRYVLGILNDRASRGGSSFIHSELRVGSTLEISPPRNNFRLEEDAGLSVLIAGGIGVTPLLAMARRLKQLGRPIVMLYCSRSRTEAAFIPELEALGIKLQRHVDDETGGPPDLKAFLSAQPDEAHFYSCGPSPMLDAFERICSELGYANTHIERFHASAIPAPSREAHASYVVELRKSGKSLTIANGQSILEAVLKAGVDCSYSCQEGICGACETKVLEGLPDHRDQVLSDAEQASNTMMMICVSGCKSDRLVLDL